MSSPNQIETKAAICVSDMAKMVGLSRQRFAQLVQAGVFPPPLNDVATRRPFYPEDLQAVCLSVRQRNVGVNGKVVMFYSRRGSGPTLAPKTRKPTSKPANADPLEDILYGVKGLGLERVKIPQVKQAVAELYPHGTSGTDLGDVIVAVFLHLNGKNARVNVQSKE
jgi:hypothetical protein